MLLVSVKIEFGTRTPLCEACWPILSMFVFSQAQDCLGIELSDVSC